MSRPQKYFLTPETKQLFIERYDGSTKIITELTRHLGVPRRVVRGWAIDLSLTQQVEWSEKEIAYLRKNIRKQSCAQIATKLHRSYDAVKNKCARLGLPRTIHSGGYTLAQVGEGLNRSQTLLRTWIKRGWLRGTKRGPAARAWNITDNALREFLLAHPEEIKWHRMSDESKLWVRDVLSKKVLSEAS